MGALEVLWEDLLDATAFSLFAIHSNAEDYILAYALNQCCGLRLQRTPEDLELDQKGFYVVFNWRDETCYREWTLFRNPGREALPSPSEGLFMDEPTMNRPFLIPEKREVDYFLKLEGEEQGLRILPQLLSIPKVITAYRLDSSELKSRHNLITF
jgi:hypothetical protein